MYDRLFFIIFECIIIILDIRDLKLIKYIFIGIINYYDLWYFFLIFIGYLYILLGENRIKEFFNDNSR